MAWDGKHLKLPEEAAYIINTLNKYGFNAHAVGGCVRDSIMGKTPEDWDIATNAQPEDVKGLFAKTVDTGIRHGTVIVILEKRSYEITTYRVDGQYKNNRHPLKVEFTPFLEEDLRRRDFTINAMAYHPEGGLIDPFNGIKDIEGKVIRCVGSPARRFNEDALRMLRAVRFSAQLDFTVEAGALNSIRVNSRLIRNISSERIRDELTKTIMSDYPSRLVLLKDTGLMGHVLPEFENCFGVSQNNPFHVDDVANHILKSLRHIEKDRILRWAMLLHDIGKPLCKSTDEKDVDHFYTHCSESECLASIILKRLKFENKAINKICRLVKYHDYNIIPGEKSVRRAVSIIGDDIFPDILKVKEADRKAQNPAILDERLKELERIRLIYSEIKRKEQCLNVRELAIKGDDLIKLGFRQGKEIGFILGRMLDAVLDNPEINDKDTLAAMAENMREEWLNCN